MKQNRKSRLKGGFTIVETMIVLALFGILGVALFSSFSMGLKVWKRSTQVNLARRKAVLALERLSMELRKTFAYQPIGFSGEKTHIAFPALIADKIYNISYDFSAEEKAVKRSGVSRQQMLDSEEEGFSRASIPQIKDFSFGYYGLDNETGNYTFLDTWNSSGSTMPSAVKITATLEDNTSLEKLVVIPVAQ